MQIAGMRRVVLWSVGAAIATLMLINHGEAQTKLAGEVNDRGAPLFNDLGNHQYRVSDVTLTALRF